MGYRVLAETTMVVHFAVLVYLVLGGFLAWRWRYAFWPHLVIAAWGLTSTVLVWPCPLTMLENWSRRQAGEAGLRTGFIDTYLTGVIYPERYTIQIQIGVGVVVAFSWLGAAVVWHRHRSARTADSPDGVPPATLARRGVTGVDVRRGGTSLAGAAERSHETRAGRPGRSRRATP